MRDYFYHININEDNLSQQTKLKYQDFKLFLRLYDTGKKRRHVYIVVQRWSECMQTQIEHSIHYIT